MLIKKLKFYKKCEEDILGDIRLKLKVNKVSNLFYIIEEEKKRLKGEYIFRLDVVQPRRKKARKSIYRTQLLFRKKILLFYGDLKLEIFRKLCKVASKQKKYSFLDKIIYLLECRLCVVVYRLNFVSSVREAKYFIKKGMIMVNKEIKKNHDYLIKEGDIIEVIDLYKNQVHNNLVERVKNKWFYTTIPTYLEVNYQILVGLCLGKPEFDGLAYPFQIDKGRFYSVYKNKIK